MIAMIKRAEVFKPKSLIIEGDEKAINASILAPKQTSH
jgi:hypothetical protein